MRDALNRLVSKPSRDRAKPYRQNEARREEWVRARLAEVPVGWTVLDVGAGEGRFRADCAHLTYISQDVAQYDGQGDGRGLQTGAFDFSKIDMVCDIYDIPEDVLYDCVLCTEVLEHIPDAPRAMRKFGKIIKPGGLLILTAPFACLVHFAPHFHSSGFSEYFYREHLKENGFVVEEISPNGSYFRQIHGEISRLGRVASQYTNSPLTLGQTRLLNDTSALLRQLIDQEEAWVGPGERAPSSDLSCFGFHVVAQKSA